MHRKFNKFLIVSFVAFTIFGVYSYFTKDLKSVSASDTGGGLTSSLDTTNTPSPAPDTNNSNASEDTAFVTKLNSLKSIKIDTSLFSDKSFMLLVDNDVLLDQAPYGRVNPFSPLSNYNVVSTPATQGITVPLN